MIKINFTDKILNFFLQTLCCVNCTELKIFFLHNDNTKMN